MPNNRQTKLRAVPEQSAEELEELRQKINIHRIRILVMGLAIASVIIMCVNVIIFYFQKITYSNYNVIDQMERIDTDASEFEEFYGNLLKYTKDGAVYSSLDGEVIWNQSYEMESPHISICEGYLAIYDQGGRKLYILNEGGLKGTIQTSIPIQCVSIANQGTVAVLTEDSGTSYLSIYDQSGKELAAGELYIEDGGFPLDIALSYDAQKLAVSRLDINEGNVKTAIVFYNYGSVGQNEIDNIVGVYSYSDLVIPRIRFVSNDRLVAFGDNEVIIYEGEQKPVVVEEIDLNEEVVSVFYDESHFGLVFAGSKSNTYAMQIYNMKGKLVCQQEFQMEFTEIHFTDNGLICIHNENQCILYTLKGDIRFQYTFDKEVYDILSGSTQRDYIFILKGETDRVKLIK